MMVAGTLFMLVIAVGTAIVSGIMAALPPEIEDKILRHCFLLDDDEIGE